MKSKSLLMFILFFSIIIFNLSCSNAEDKVNPNKVLIDPDEIIFYSNASIFSPVIVLQGNATVTWTWADSTTSNSTAPIKNYGSTQLRKNSLKVTPWSALQRINIGYDGLDGGSKDIEFVADQNVSSVENLYLVAPYLKVWCSSYNNIDSLDFNNFINLETIECFNSISLKHVQLSNTPKLKRVCFEDNDLLELDMRDCNSLEDFRGAMNNFRTVVFPTHSEKIWHLCIHDNLTINDHLFNNLRQFQMITHLWIQDTNQHGVLVMPKSNYNGECSIWGWNNKYSAIDLRGAYQNGNLNGYVNMSFNELTRVDISGCIQINELYLQNNKLSSEAIDHVLKQVDDFGTSNGTIDLRHNKPPTATGLTYKTNLEKRGWIVNTDEVITGNIQNRKDSYSFNVYSDLSNDKIKVELDKVPDEALMLEIWDVSGVKLLSQKIFNNIYEFSLKSPGIYFFTLKCKDWVNTQKFISYK